MHTQLSPISTKKVSVDHLEDNIVTGFLKSLQPIILLVSYFLKHFLMFVSTCHDIELNIEYTPVCLMYQALLMQLLVTPSRNSCFWCTFLIRPNAYDLSTMTPASSARMLISRSLFFAFHSCHWWKERNSSMMRGNITHVEGRK